MSQNPEEYQWRDKLDNGNKGKKVKSNVFFYALYIG